MSTIEERARADYEACPTPKPSWDQLTEVTKSVWRERVNPPTIRVELALSVTPGSRCDVGSLAAVRLHDNSEVFIVAPNASKLKDALLRMPHVSATTPIEAAVFRASDVQLDDEI